ncbi:MAG: alkaline phosphatase D family protein [Betaproteobacteria bacterium]|nr:alkaline phosphatase D family protein [Betaproteobacteria bacterium]
MLDTRQYRDQGGYGPGVGLTLLGARQLLWLKAGLKASTATFKFICTSVPFHQGGIDKWGGFKVERQALVDFIRREGIRNVVILSADLHAAGDLSDDKTGLIEFLVGPIAAPLQPVLAPNSRTRETARPGSYVGDAYNFGLIRIAQREGKSVLRHEVVDAQGSCGIRGKSWLLARMPKERRCGAEVSPPLTLTLSRLRERELSATLQSAATTGGCVGARLPPSPSHSCRSILC